MITIQKERGGAQIVFDDRQFILNEIKIDEIKGDHATSKNIGQHGETVNSTTLEPRDATVTGYILADNKDDMDAKKQLLVDVINPLDTVVIKRGDKVLKGKPVSTPALSNDYKTSNSYVQKFVVVLYCAHPFWRDEYTSVDYIATWIPALHFPLIFPQGEPIIFGYRSPSLIVNLANHGAIDVGMVIIFTAIGTVTSPSLFNVNTREGIKINVVMQAGDVIRIDTRFDKNTIILNRGGVESNIFGALDDEMDDFLQLKPGNNLFRYDADDNLDGLEVTIERNNDYIEVFS